MTTQTTTETATDTRRAWAPKGAIRIAAKGCNAEAYVGTRTTPMGELPYALLWSGRCRKPAKASGTFHSTEARNRAVAEHFEMVRRTEARRAERAAARKAARAAHNFEVGSIVVSSWGYEQTNVDAYQVVEIRGKSTVILRKVAVEVVEDGVSQSVRPVRDGFLSEETLRRRMLDADSVKINGSCWASLWDGERTYHRTAFGFGH